jgi:hypothetical protein
VSKLSDKKPVTKTREKTTKLATHTPRGTRPQTAPARINSSQLPLLQGNALPSPSEIAVLAL